MSTAEVRMWGRTIGAVSWNESAQIGEFQYDPGFARSGIQVCPFTMPLSDRIYSFPALSRQSFKGLPGLLADSLPDDFGNALIDRWLAESGRDRSDFNPVERLCYTGTRGMGALEYHPALGPYSKSSDPVEIDILVDLANRALAQRRGLEASFDADTREESLRQILLVGTSAAGARPKAIIAWNENTNEVRTGQVKASEGFTYWLLKFDGVVNTQDERTLEDPKGYGLIEYAYSEMAKAAGVEMVECRLLSENDRHHFMTKRFDRSDTFQRLHMLSLGALEHFDFRSPGAYGYEQVFQTIQKLGLSMGDIEQQFRRVAFNIIARNQDDHVKNITFLMDKNGNWYLSPAYDVTYSYNPTGIWTANHQMTLNGKNNNFVLDDFRSCARSASMKRGRSESIVEDVTQAVSRWPEFASASNVQEEKMIRIKNTHRLDILG